MKKLKVLFFETHWFAKESVGSSHIHTAGVDFARSINPANHLRNHPDFEVDLRKDPLKSSWGKEVTETDWPEIAEKWDMVYTSYIDSPVGYVQMAFNFKNKNKPFVMDLDDNVWEVPRSSPVYASVHPGSESLNFTSLAIEDSPYMTTTNPFLKNQINKYTFKSHDRIKVIPNFIDLEIHDYKKLKPKQNKDSINIYYFGTGTHYEDLFQPMFRNALRRIMKEFPQVTFFTTGLWMIQFKDYYKTQYKWVLGKRDVYEWHELWKQIMGDADIVVAPLVPSSFNRSKSNIKFLEFSAAKKPGVYQDIRQYQEMVKDNYQGMGPTGLLAGTEESWYKNLKRLVEDEKLRRDIGEAAYKYVCDNHDISKKVDLYADYFKWVYQENLKHGNLDKIGFVMPGKELLDQLPEPVLIK